MEEKKKLTQSENFKNAVCYAPFGAIVMFFVENKKSDSLKKNIKYGMVIFLLYIIGQAILPGFLGGLWAMIYVGICIFFGMKAYNGEKVEIEYIDKAEKTIKEKL